jgi:hypothetical protein
MQTGTGHCKKKENSLAMPVQLTKWSPVNFWELKSKLHYSYHYHAVGFLQTPPPLTTNFQPAFGFWFGKAS